MSRCPSAAESYFVEPTPDRLQNLGSGCYVQINHGGSCCWVELTGGRAGEYVGVIHPELSEDKAGCGEQVCVRAEQVNALGCDRYCFCD